MPIRIKQPSSSTPQPPVYFDSLRDFDGWKPSGAFNNVLRYIARKPSASGRGKLLVCHDYKGGYREDPGSVSYTFNHWSTCDTFVYFSHHRVTIPPAGWITAAHRQGVKILGTLILEGGIEGESDALRLLVGELPRAKMGVTSSQSQFHATTLPVTKLYASMLADLANERGFDGYLLNVECSLIGRTEQTRALAAWITLLRSEILRKVGPHGEITWYDSVTIAGSLVWQNRLNSYNLPFFLSSSNFFSNYCWPPQFPALTVQYFKDLDRELTGTSRYHVSSKTLQDIYMGIDVWGRGSHGGGGLGCYRALTHVDPSGMGLSVALFGQAWTWETEQDKPGWSWNAWWEYDGKLWNGAISGEVPVPPAPRKKGEPECPHGPFVPISSFFVKQTPPNPYHLPFLTNFCPGAGFGWFVNGVKVFDNVTGWTDVDKMTSMANMVWPCPSLEWEDERNDELPTVVPSVDMTVAWSGGSSLKLEYSLGASKPVLAIHQAFTTPLQSLTITPGISYQAEVIYKLEQLPNEISQVLIDIAVKNGHEGRVLSHESKNIDLLREYDPSADLGGRWKRATVSFRGALGPEKNGETGDSAEVVIGLTTSLMVERWAESCKFTLILGQLSVISLPPPDLQSEFDARILWVNFERDQGSTTSSLWHVSGELSWEISAAFPVITSLPPKSPDDLVPMWKVQPSDAWMPTFAYCNIYVEIDSDPDWASRMSVPVMARWIRTSDYNERTCFVSVGHEIIGSRPGRLRFYVQGVTDRGVTLDWNKCAFVEVVL